MINAALRRSLVLLALAGLLAGASACGSNDSAGGSSGSGGPSAAASTTAAATQAATPLTFSLVEQLTAPRFTKDPNCAYGEWGTNSTGVDEKYRAKSTFFRQFDCYKKKPEISGGAFPDRIQQSIYVEFSDAATAKAYADEQSALYKTLIDDTKVVVAGTGLETVDMDAYLADIKNACGCGTVVGST